MTGCIAWLRYHLHEHCSDSVKAWVIKPSKTTTKRWHCSGNEKKKLKQQPTVNNQNTEDDLKLLWSIQSITNITTLLSTRDWATYARTSTESTRVRTATHCSVFRQPSFRISSAAFDRHLLCGASLLGNHEYLLPGAEKSQHRGTTRRGLFQGVVVRRGSLVFIYIEDVLWHRFDLETLVCRSQLVESLEEMRRERVI